MSQPIYHITSQEDWDEARRQGAYHHPSLTSEGFIHCAYAHQLEGVLERFFVGWTQVTILCIDPERVLSGIRIEGPISEGGPFPHLYGPLNLDAVWRIVSLEPDAHGRFELPPTWVGEGDGSR